MPALSEEKPLHFFFFLPNTPGYYTYRGLRDGCAGREALIVSLFCEHIAIPVMLVFLLPAILNTNFSLRIALYIHSCTIVLDISVTLKYIY